ncbi:MAG TPA: carboxypeptidase-like regulatory domain-containing protein, partial [Sunxiuqinia sp.]|nr:carboxypeptidase-like regulatory domain-containing protein [Sunxiuqinia sp.]
MLRKAIFLLGLYIGAAGVLQASDDGDGKSDHKIISGYIKDANTGESLIGASVLVKELGVGTISNNYGFYSLSVSPGTYTIVCSYIGYQSQEQSIELMGNERLEI